MARINLLPWREELRKEQQKQFLAVLGLATGAALFVMFIVHSFYEDKISYQNARNAYLQSEIAILDRQIKEIDELESTKQNLQARLDIIQRLQSSRPEIVHLFDELVRTLPEGVYLTKATQRGNLISVDGVAQSNARVSSYMWNIDKSEWLGNPQLDVIQTAQADGQRSSKFVLRANQTRKSKEQAEKGQ